MNRYGYTVYRIHFKYNTTSDHIGVWVHVQIVSAQIVSGKNKLYRYKLYRHNLYRHNLYRDVLADGHLSRGMIPKASGQRRRCSKTCMTVLAKTVSDFGFLLCRQEFSLLTVDTASDGTDFVLALVSVVGGQPCRRGVAGVTGGFSVGLDV